MKRLLFTIPYCPNCPIAKNLLEVKGITYEPIDALKPEGLALAKRYGVGSVPSLIVLEKEKIADSARGLAEIEAFLDHAS